MQSEKHVKKIKNLTCCSAYEQRNIKHLFILHDLICRIIEYIYISHNQYMTSLTTILHNFFQLQFLSSKLIQGNPLYTTTNWMLKDLKFIHRYITKLVSNEMGFVSFYSSSFFLLLCFLPFTPFLEPFYFLSSVFANLPRTLGWLSARAFLQAY